MVDIGGLVYGNAYNCTAQQGIPTIELLNVLPSELAEFAPYLAGPAADAGASMRSAAQGLREQGFFDPANGFVKLGLLLDECAPELNATFQEWVGRMGVTSSQVSVYTFACPESGFASPADMAQAVAQHRSAGVTHVVPLTGGGSFDNYTETAERQAYRPRTGSPTTTRS